MRIAAGSLKGRVVPAPPGRAVRPTGARVRAALFDILQHNDWPGLTGHWPFVRVLDVFAGSGALGIEALSRGCRSGVFFDADRQTADALSQTLAVLELDGITRVHRADALHPPPARGAPADLVLVDPPYGRGLAAPALAALDRTGWLAPAAVLAVELPRRDDPPAAPGFALHADRRYGDTRIVVLARGG